MSIPLLLYLNNWSTLIMDTKIPYDMSYFISLKKTIEHLFGQDAWYELKETTSIAAWRRYLRKTVQALQIAIEETVHADETWHEEVSELLNRCNDRLRSAKTFDDLISCFTATLLRLNFLQIGQIPSYPQKDKRSLHRSNWRLDSYRSVIYAQKPAQRAQLFWSKQQKQIGFRAQMDLYYEHRRSNSPLSYEKWCIHRESNQQTELEEDQ